MLFNNDYESNDDFISFEKDEDILNKSDLFEYEIYNEIVGVNSDALVFQHDINTDKIVNKDHFGYGIIMKKIKKEKAIQILNEQLLKKKKNLSTISVSSQVSSNNFLIRKRNKRKTTKKNSFMNFRKEPTIEYKIQIKGLEDEKRDQMFFSSTIDKNVLLNLINKEKANNNISKIIRNIKIIGSDEDSLKISTKKGTNIGLNTKYPKYNKLIKININDKINLNDNDKKNNSSKQILHFNNFKNKNSPLKRTISIQTSILKKKSMNSTNRIVHIDNSIFHLSLKKRK